MSFKCSQLSESSHEREHISKDENSHGAIQDRAPNDRIANCRIERGDAREVLPKLPKESVQLIYIDPPFNTGKRMTYNKIATEKNANGGRTGYNGKRYETHNISKLSYDDKYDEYVEYITERIKLALPLLAKDGSLFLHIDYRESHYLKVELDKIFGRENFINEIIWSYDYGGRSKNKWPAKHDTILWYAVNKDDYIFNYEAIDRIPYMAPALVGEKKAKKGKTPTDVWWNSIVGTNSKERDGGRGYPTQKPLAILERIVLVHSNENDTVLDFFAGSGTTGVAAIKNKRKAILVDSNPAAIEIIRQRISEVR